MQTAQNKFADRENAHAEEILNSFPRMFAKVAIAPLTHPHAEAKCPAPNTET